MDNRLVLSSLKMSDLPEVHAIHSDARLRSLRMAYRSPVSRRQAEMWLSARLTRGSEGIYFAVREAEDGPCKGYVSLTDLDWVSRTAEVGIVLDTQGRGYGQEAIRKLMDRSYGSLQLRRLTARVVSHNMPARRLFDKCGFHSEGILRRHYFDLGGYHDVYLFAHEMTQ